MILYPETRYLPQAKTIHLLKNKAKRFKFPTISARERALLLQAPSAYKTQNKSFTDKGESSNRGQNENLQKLKELLERIIKKDSSDPAKPLPSISKSPLRNKSIENNKKTSEKFVLTANKRIKINKPLITRKKEKKSKPKFNLNTLTVLSRSFSKKSFEKSFKLNKEENDKSGRLDRRIKCRILQKEKEKEIWEELQKDHGIAGLILNGNSRVSRYPQLPVAVSERNPGIVSAGARNRDFGCFFRNDVADCSRGKDELRSESDEDRIDVYDDFMYV